MIKFIFYLSLIILGMFAMRFGIIQIRKYKQGQTKVKKKSLEQIAFGVFFIIITFSYKNHVVIKRNIYNL